MSPSLKALFKFACICGKRRRLSIGVAQLLHDSTDVVRTARSCIEAAVAANVVVSPLARKAVAAKRGASGKGGRAAATVGAGDSAGPQHQACLQRASNRFWPCHTCWQAACSPGVGNCCSLVLDTRGGRHARQRRHGAERCRSRDSPYIRGTPTSTLSCLSQPPGSPARDGNIARCGCGPLPGSSPLCAVNRDMAPRLAGAPAQPFAERLQRTTACWQLDLKALVGSRGGGGSGPYAAWTQALAATAAAAPSPRRRLAAAA